MHDIHAIILAYNESLHLERCIRSLGEVCTSITVVDSGSTDDTIDIARALGATVLSNPWTNYATQLNFAIDALAGCGGWLLRIDADEVVDPESRETLSEAVAQAGKGTDGLLVKRRIHFLGRRMQHGAIEPSWQLRLFRNGHGRCERRWMDEHVHVEGEIRKTKVVISDINLKSISWWTDKHNTYASREAIDVLNGKYGILVCEGRLDRSLGRQAKARRFVKERIYRRVPAPFRAWIYFLYRFFLRLGFMDGSAGFYFHMLQGLWYRTLVDAKVLEIEACADLEGISIREAIRICTGLEPMKTEAETSS